MSRFIDILVGIIAILLYLALIGGLVYACIISINRSDLFSAFIFGTFAFGFLVSGLGIVSIILNTRG